MAPLFHPLLENLNIDSVVALIAVIAGLILFFIDYLLLRVPYPKGIPLLREPEGATWFSLRTRLAYYTNCEALFRDAYQNVSLTSVISSYSKRTIF